MCVTILQLCDLWLLLQNKNKKFFFLNVSVPANKHEPVNKSVFNVDENDFSLAIKSSLKTFKTSITSK